jgi:hypothetical protein
MLGTGKTITTSLVESSVIACLTFHFLSETDDSFAPAASLSTGKGHSSVRKTFNHFLFAEFILARRSRVSLPCINLEGKPTHAQRSYSEMAYVL